MLTQLKGDNAYSTAIINLSVSVMPMTNPLIWMMYTSRSTLHSNCISYIIFIPSNKSVINICKSRLILSKITGLVIEEFAQFTQLIPLHLLSPLFIPTTYSASYSRLIHPPMLNMSWQLTQHIAVRIIFANTELFLPSLKVAFRNQKFTNSLRMIPSHLLSFNYFLKVASTAIFYGPKGNPTDSDFFINKVKS